MAEKKKRQAAPPEQEARAAGAKQEPQPETCAAQAPAGAQEAPLPEEMQALIRENEEILKEVEQLREDAAKTRDALLRTTAEYENFRRRSAEEKAKIHGDATADAAAQLLPVLDNLDRALAVEHADGDPVYQGMAMIAGQIREAFQALGVEEIPTDGAFDPKLHNAVMHVEQEDLPENAIAEVFAKGYRLGERVLRHSMVKVAN